MKKIPTASKKKNLLGPVDDVQWVFPTLTFQKGFLINLTLPIKGGGFLKSQEGGFLNLTFPIKLVFALRDFQNFSQYPFLFLCCRMSRYAAFLPCVHDR